MHEQIQRIEQNLIRLERTFQRGHEHLLEVMGSQRERIVKALDSLKTEFRFALLDQEVALRGELLNLHGGFNGLREGMLDLTRTISDHEDRLLRLEAERSPAA
ncbi:hypothetical protein DYH09_11555 [bacterium CPR1]|nr:hypothetical protein [bacterium CPR1]